MVSQRVNETAAFEEWARRMDVFMAASIVLDSVVLVRHKISHINWGDKNNNAHEKNVKGLPIAASSPITIRGSRHLSTSWLLTRNGMNRSSPRKKLYPMMATFGIRQM